jgi:hypothetical protein
MKRAHQEMCPFFLSATESVGGDFDTVWPHDGNFEPLNPGVTIVLDALSKLRRA